MASQRIFKSSESSGLPPQASGALLGVSGPWLRTFRLGWLGEAPT